MIPNYRVSVVIPTWNEAGRVSSAISSAWTAGADEVIVSDGGSLDGTWEQLGQDPRVVAIRSRRGRGRQLIAGAAAATGDWLIFLHADNQLPADAVDQLRNQNWPDWGGFKQHIDAPENRYRWIERGNWIRLRYRSMVFGDQALFARREVYQKVGGYPDFDIMEDVAMSRRLRRVCPATCLDGPVHVDPRRWQNAGVVRQTIRNWGLQLAFSCGVSPHRLKAWYYAD